MDFGNKPKALLKHLLLSQKLRIPSIELKEKDNKLQIQPRTLVYQLP